MLYVVAGELAAVLGRATGSEWKWGQPSVYRAKASVAHDFLPRVVIREDKMIDSAPGFWPIFGPLGPRKPRERPRLEQ